MSVDIVIESAEFVVSDFQVGDNELIVRVRLLNKNIGGSQSREDVVEVGKWREWSNEWRNELQRVEGSRRLVTKRKWFFQTLSIELKASTLAKFRNGNCSSVKIEIFPGKTAADVEKNADNPLAFTEISIRECVLGKRVCGKFPLDGEFESAFIQFSAVPSRKLIDFTFGARLLTFSDLKINEVPRQLYEDVVEQQEKEEDEHSKGEKLCEICEEKNRTVCFSASFKDAHDEIQTLKSRLLALRVHFEEGQVSWSLDEVNAEEIDEIILTADTCKMLSKFPVEGTLSLQQEGKALIKYQIDLTSFQVPGILQVELIENGLHWRTQISRPLKMADEELLLTSTRTFEDVARVSSCFLKEKLKSPLSAGSFMAKREPLLRERAINVESARIAILEALERKIFHGLEGKSKEARKSELMARILCEKQQNLAWDDPLEERDMGKHFCKLAEESAFKEQTDRAIQMYCISLDHGCHACLSFAKFLMRIGKLGPAIEVFLRRPQMQETMRTPYPLGERVKTMNPTIFNFSEDSDLLLALARYEAGDEIAVEFDDDDVPSSGEISQSLLVKTWLILSRVLANLNLRKCCKRILMKVHMVTGDEAIIDENHVLYEQIRAQLKKSPQVATSILSKALKENEHVTQVNVSELVRAETFYMLGRSQEATSRNESRSSYASCMAILNEMRERSNKPCDRPHARDELRQNLTFRMAKMALESRDLRKAKLIFKNAVNIQEPVIGTMSWAWFGLGVACMALKDFNAADEALRQSLITDSWDPNTWAQFSILQYQTQTIAQAETSMQAAFDLDLKNEELRATLQSFRGSQHFQDKEASPRTGDSEESKLYIRILKDGSNSLDKIE